MSSTEPMKIMNLKQALDNSEIIGSELDNINKKNEENVSGLMGMLYSIPKAVTQNRNIYNLFNEELVKDEDEESDYDTNSELNAEGESIRKFISGDETQDTEQYYSLSNQFENPPEEEKSSTNESKENEKKEKTSEDKENGFDKDDILKDMDEELQKLGMEDIDVDENHLEETLKDLGMENINIDDDHLEETLKNLKNKVANNEIDLKKYKYLLYALREILSENEEDENEEDDNIQDSNNSNNLEETAGITDNITGNTEETAKVTDNIAGNTEEITETENSKGAFNKLKSFFLAPRKFFKKMKKKKDENQDNETTAEKLRENAKDLANAGSYGMATKQGIEEFSKLLNDLLEYSSTFRNNKPIKELVRNFNSMKAVESHLVGDKDTLKIIPDKDDLTEIPSKSEKARMSMQRTYADKILALNRFEYSEKVETMIKNALLDIYQQNKNLENKKAQNIAAVLLPLLRTKSYPEGGYNYDFQYDVLREIIRQEEFYNEYNDDRYPSNKKSPVKVNRLVAQFALLRYLKTLLYDEGTQSNNSNNTVKCNECNLIEKEAFVGSLYSSLESALNGGTVSDDVNKLKTTSPEYKKYLPFKQYMLSKSEIKTTIDSMGITDAYRSVISNLHNNKQQPVDLSNLKGNLKNLAELVDKLEDKPKNTTDFVSIIEKLESVLTSNSDYNILKLCGQDKNSIISLMNLFNDKIEEEESLSKTQTQQKTEPGTAQPAAAATTNAQETAATQSQTAK